LVRSYALDAMDSQRRSSAAESQRDVAAMLEAIGGAPTSSDKGVGLGKNVRFTGHRVTGAALWAEGRYVHICAFVRRRSDGEGPAVWTHLTRQSRRPLF